MSWEKQNKDYPFSITTGDGKKWKPKIEEESVDIAFNMSAYSYRNIEGEYVERKRAKSDVFPIEFTFSGENHLFYMRAFRKSTRDPRPWKLESPAFGSIICQPTSLSIKVRGNTSVVSGNLMLTINSKLLSDEVDAKLIITQIMDNMEIEIIGAALPQNIADGKSLAEKFLKAYKAVAKTAEQINDLKNKARAVARAAENILDDAKAFAESVKELVLFPFQVLASVQQAYRQMIAAFDSLIDLFQTDPQQANLVSGFLMSGGTKLAVSSDYETRAKAAESRSLLTELYNKQITAYEQSGNEQESSTMLAIANAYALAMQYINEQSATAKQELIIEADKSAPPIYFVSKYYGFTDENLTKFAIDNNLTQDEQILISQGRELVFYI
jgi:hypothetical protein